MARGDFHLLFVHLLPQIFLKAESRNHVITFLPRFRRNGKREWNKKRKRRRRIEAASGPFSVTPSSSPKGFLDCTNRNGGRPRWRRWLRPSALPHGLKYKAVGESRKRRRRKEKKVFLIMGGHERRRRGKARGKQKRQVRRRRAEMESYPREKSI